MQHGQDELSLGAGSGKEGSWGVERMELVEGDGSREFLGLETTPGS